MDCVVIIDKPKDYTSRDIVNIISKKFKTKKVGHTGTLDPLATGVLIICINKATKIAELLTSTDKEYVAEFIIGTLTDTLDNTGTILLEQPSYYKKEEITNVLNQMIGTYEQEVPIYSAVKVNGKKLYEYARNNEPVILPKHTVNIKKIELLDINNIDNKTIIKVKCLVSKGTYIRALGYDIAVKLNNIAIMSNLRRIKQGKFDISESYTLDQIMSDNYRLLDISSVLDFPKVEIDESLFQKIKNGAIINNIYKEETVLFTYQNKPISIYKKYDKDNQKLKPWKML